MSLKNSITQFTRNTMMSARKHSPEILVVTGAVAAVAGTVLACKATLDVQEPLKECKDDIEAIKDMNGCGEYENDGEYRKELTKAYARTAGVVAKHYALPVALEAAALGTIFASNNISRKRNAGLTTALASAQTMYEKYRANVIDKYGEDEDRNLRLGLHKEKVTVEETDEETGKKTKSKQEVNVINKNKVVGKYLRCFDESSCQWNKSFMANKDFLAAAQNYWNDVLRARGYVFVNEILDYLDLSMDEEGQVDGWIYDPTNSGLRKNFIDFGIFDAIDDEAKRNFVNGWERNVFINLEPDGYIADKIWPKNISHIPGDFKRPGMC